ncbi:hypothetical protein [Streptomyces antibioticus]|uniref:hypothetical protein n=1 Tax=Streptomyces antibioticus TaxID=1890 RepID=UPI0033F5C6A7
MAATVWMRHPALPSEQLIQVPETSVPHHQAAGWEVTEPPAPKPKPAAAVEASAADAPEDPAPDEAAATKPTRKRRASTIEAEES